MPEWAESYLALLADSSNSNRSMQRHLVKLAVRGVADTAKAVNLLQDPNTAAVDLLADRSSRLLVSKVAKSNQQLAEAAMQTSEAQAKVGPSGPSKLLRGPSWGVHTSFFLKRSASLDGSCEVPDCSASLASSALHASHSGTSLAPAQHPQGEEAAEAAGPLPRRSSSLTPRQQAQAKAVSVLLSVMMSAATPSIHDASAAIMQDGMQVSTSTGPGRRSPPHHHGP